MTPEAPRPNRETDIARKNEAREQRSSKSTNDIAYSKPDTEKKAETDAILTKLNLQAEFSQLLTPAEMASLRISIDHGHTLETSPPTCLASLGVSFVRGGKRVTMEQGMRWTGEVGGAGGISLESTETSDDVKSPTDVLLGIPDVHVSKALLTIAARIAENKLAEKQDNYDTILDGDTKAPKGPEKKERFAPRTAEEMKRDMDKLAANIDGEKVLREAAAKLPNMDTEVFENAMKGPPQIDGKTFGTILVKSSVIMEEIGKHLKNHPLSDSTDIIVDAIVDATANAEFMLGSMVRFCVAMGEKGEKRAKGESSLPPESVAAMKELNTKYEAGVTPQELDAEKGFMKNAKEYVRKGIAEGRSFTSAEEKDAQKNGRGYIVEWMSARTFEKLGIYRDIESQGKSSASPVLLTFEKSKTKETPKPTLTLTPKPGQNSEALVDAIAKVIGPERIRNLYGTWQIAEISLGEIEKVQRELRRVFEKKTV